MKDDSNRRFQMVTIATCQTAFGWVAIAASERGLVRVTLPVTTEAKARDLLMDLGYVHSDTQGLLDSVKRCLQAFYAGKPVDFDDVLLDPTVGTPFFRRVWAITRCIPRGQTRTYGDLARELGSPALARAVGRAMATNPWPPIVPCHRVVGSRGQLTGFGGGLRMKRRLLEMEGVSKFDEDAVCMVS